MSNNNFQYVKESPEINNLENNSELYDTTYEVKESIVEKKQVHIKKDDLMGWDLQNKYKYL